MVIDCCTDITVAVGGSMREPDAEKKMALRKTLADETLPRWFGYLEKLLQDNGATASFVGSSITIADIAVWRMLGWLKGGILDGIPSTVADPFPLLTAHFKAVDEHPKIRAWMDSKYPKK
jgi:glutathione S-transferase